MNGQKTFKEKWEMANHNLLCYSATYWMNSPKPGFEKEWKNAYEEVGALKCIAACYKINLLTL